MSSYWQRRNVTLTIVLDEDQASLKEEHTDTFNKQRVAYKVKENCNTLHLNF